MRKSLALLSFDVGALESVCSPLILIRIAPFFSTFLFHSFARSIRLFVSFCVFVSTTNSRSVCAHIITTFIRSAQETTVFIALSVHGRAMSIHDATHFPAFVSVCVCVNECVCVYLGLLCVRVCVCQLYVMMMIIKANIMKMGKKTHIQAMELSLHTFGRAQDEFCWETRAHSHTHTPICWHTNTNTIPTRRKKTLSLSLSEIFAPAATSPVPSTHHGVVQFIEKNFGDFENLNITAFILVHL